MSVPGLLAPAVCGTSSHVRPWTDVAVQEVKAFWGVLLYMDITIPPRLELDWTTKCPMNIHGDLMPCPSIGFSSCSGAAT